jgi:hypothetical protein
MRQTRANLSNGRIAKGVRAVRDNWVDPFSKYPQMAAGIPGSSKEFEQLQTQDFMPQARARYV